MITMPKFNKNREKRIRGFALTWKSKKNSSKRTVAATNLIDEARTEQVQKNTKKLCRQNKKEHKLEGVFEIKANQSKSLSPEEAHGMTFGPNPDLDVYTSETAKVHWIDRENGVFSVMVIPRETILKRVNEKNTAATVKALEMLQKTEKSCKRSATKAGKSTSNARYLIFGNKSNRGGHGFVHDRLSQVAPHSARTLERFARRMEDAAAEYVPSGWLRGIAKANGLGAWPTLDKCKFVAAMASSVDYNAPAHVDDDFLFSIHQLNEIAQLFNE